MRKNIIFLLFGLLLSSGAVLAQKLIEFTPDSVKFIKELDQYFQAGSADKKEAADFVNEFEKAWKDPVFKLQYKEYVYKTCNKFLDKKLKPNPYFKDYLTAIVSFIDAKQEFSSFENWQTCIEKTLKGKGMKAIGDFLEMSLSLFETNTFYKSPTYNWYTLEKNYKFEYDSLPKLIFGNITLSGKNPRNDSVSINATTGIYYPSLGKFYGKGGRVSWQRTGLEENVYADLKRYVIDCKTGNYTSDSALFRNDRYFPKPQLGRLSDRIISEDKDLISYPRFDTYSKRIVVKNVLKDVDFDGGFSMRGPRFVGSGDSKNPARIVFYRKGQRFLELAARNFIMNPDKISSETAAVKFSLGKDSIIHPGLSFKYIAEQRKVSLIRTDDGLQKTPYYNSYHKVDMYFEELIWKIDSPKVDFGFLAGNHQGNAYFESENFYTQERMDKLRGLDEVNPLVKIKKFFDEYGIDQTFTAVDLAKYMKWTAVDLRPILVKIATMGMIFYNVETDEIAMKSKLNNYLLASKKQIDYDILSIHSFIPGRTNATLNLLNDNFDIRVRGVKQLLLSDTQQVFVFPKNQELILKKNRLLTFSGVVAAGKFEFHGKDYEYNYENNKISMKTIDSLRIYVNEENKNGELTNRFRMVQTVIENLSGELAVDGPTNHAGYKKAPSFPIFKSFKESYAFYDKRSIQRGVYNKDKFYFKVDPFTIDSVDNFRNEQLEFDGEFTSAGIFPTFREKLKLQPDYSLGFVRKTPPGGYEAYGGKGKFENEMRLSNKGLRGEGDITFGPSISHGRDWIFFPDSTNGMADTFIVKETENPNEFPQVGGKNVYMHWKPYNDLMQAYDKKIPFATYNYQAEFRGRYDLTPVELTGRGKIDFEKKADLLANKILFKQKKFFSDTSDFHLKQFDEEGFTFATDNVNSTIDFTNRTGTFVTNGKGSVVRFPKNQYIAFMDRFKWFMDSENIQLGDDQKKLDMDLENSLDIEGPEFISVHPQQDSLRFFAPAANYNLRKNIIKALNVPFINIADARAFPDSGKVTVFRNAVMDTLKRAVLMANTVTKYHNIRNVTANIYGRKSYLASGDYTYFDENDKPYLIKLAVIKPDTAGQTISEGYIPDSARFKFNDFLSFAGKVKLFASNQFLTFDGGTKMVHNCGRIGKSYLKFIGEIDPKEILIPVSAEPQDMNGAEVGTGIFFRQDSTKVYSSFLSPIAGKRDKPIITAEGFLTFDKESKEYRIASKEKIEETNLPGNFMSLNTGSCEVYGEGKLELGADLGQVIMNTAGSGTHYTINDSAVFRVMTTIDFFFEDKALRKMFTDFEVYLNTLTPVDFGDKAYEKGLHEFIGKEKTDKAISDLNLYGNFKRFPDELNKTLFLNDVKFRYDKKSKSYLSFDKIGIGNIYKDELNRYVPGLIQIKKQRSGDIITIYFELDQSTWYYFSYYKGVMTAVSSNKEFNDIIKEMDPKKRKMKVDKGPSYQFTFANPLKKDQFLKKLKATTEE
jgi:hypothetical protein